MFALSPSELLLIHVLGLSSESRVSSSDVPPNANAEQLPPEIQVGSTLIPNNNEVDHVSDGKSDKEEPQCQLNLQTSPDGEVPVVHGTATEIAASHVSGESQCYSFVHSSAIESVDHEIPQTNAEVLTSSVSLYLFSNPAVKGSVDFTTSVTTENAASTLCSKSYYLFSDPIELCSVPGDTEVLTSSVTDESQQLTSEFVACNSQLHMVEDIALSSSEEAICSMAGESHNLSSEPVVQSSAGSITPITTEVAASSVTNTTKSGCNDIGTLLLPSKSIDEITSIMRNLSNSEKYSLLFNHIEPPHVLPCTYAFGCSRKFNVEWLKKYAWLRYSPKLDGVFCGPCSVLLTDNRASKGLFVNRPFSQWVKISDSLKKHAKLVYHRQAVQSADILKETIDNPNSRLDVMSSSILQSNITENKHIFKQIVRAIEYLAKQGLAFRGHRERTESTSNPGNFLSLLRVFSEDDDVLRTHLQKPKVKNATYLSPSSQNDIIEVIGFDYIRANIIADIKQAPYFSVIPDEVSSHNSEYLSLCLRCIDADCEIQEKFVAFVKLPRIRASDISKAILDMLGKLELSVSDLRGQCYDGASNMRGQKSGVQKQIRDLQLKALYTHCAGHSLNLVIVSSCTIPSVRNCISQIKSLTIWIKSSPKRERFLKSIVQKGIQQGVISNRSPILNVCITRWVENINGWERFCQTFPFLVEMLECIIYGTADSDFETYNDGWTGEDKTAALAQLKALESFEFIYVLVALQRSLMYIKEAVIKLQGEQQDLASGIAQIEKCGKDLKSLRTNANDFSSRIFYHASVIANIAISSPRISRHQQHRANQPTESVEEYFKVSVVIPFLDHLSSELSCRFDAHIKQVALVQHLIPRKITQSSSYADIDQVVQYYKDDLPNRCIVDEEFDRWKHKWVSIPVSKRPETLNECLKESCLKSLPNLFVLLQIFATIPMTSCSCERSASGIRRLNNYLRATQGEERLGALAVIHSNYGTPLDRDHILRLFMTKHSRRMECGTLL